MTPSPFDADIIYGSSLAAVGPLSPGAVVRATNEGTGTVTVTHAWSLHLCARAWFVATQVVSIGCWALFSAALGYSWRTVSLLTYRVIRIFAV